RLGPAAPSYQPTSPRQPAAPSRRESDRHSAPRVRAPRAGRAECRDRHEPSRHDESARAKKHPSRANATPPSPAPRARSPAPRGHEREAKPPSTALPTGKMRRLYIEVRRERGEAIFLEYLEV